MRATSRAIFSSILFLAAAVISTRDSFGQQKANTAIVFVADGMRQDFIKRFAGEGKMPAYDRLLKRGVDAGPGMIPPVPPNSGVAWTTLGTAASPSVSGITGNSFHDNTQPFAAYGISAWTPGSNRAQTLAARAEEAGLRVAVLGWQTFDKSTITKGIVIEPDPRWITGAGVIANYDVGLQYTDIRSPLNPTLTLDKVQLKEATGWINSPKTFSPARETTFSIQCLSCKNRDSLTYNVLLIDSTNDNVSNYDRALISSRKDGASAVANLKAGQWPRNVKASLSATSGGFYVKAIELKPDLSRFRLYFTPLTRVQASRQDVENYLFESFDTVMPDDFYPFVAGLIDAETYIEQSLRHADTLSRQIYPYVLRKFKPDLVMAGLGITDSIEHRMLAWAMPGNELYDPAHGPAYWNYIERSYRATDSMLDSLWKDMPSANVFAASDHGMTISGKVINANYLLETIGLFDSKNLAASKAVAYGTGGLTQVSIAPSRY